MEVTLRKFLQQTPIVVCYVVKLSLLLAVAGCAGGSAMESGTGSGFAPSLPSGLMQTMSSALGTVGRSSSGNLGMLSGLMAPIVQSLSDDQRRQREQALQQVAREPVGASTRWASSSNSGGTSTQSRPATLTKASYVNKGHVTNASGQKCSKVQETIVLPDGKQGTSEELVCPS